MSNIFFFPPLINTLFLCSYWEVDGIKDNRQTWVQVKGKNGKKRKKKITEYLVSFLVNFKAETLISIHSGREGEKIPGELPVGIFKR